MCDCKSLYTPMEKGLKFAAKADSKPANESIFKEIKSMIYLTTPRPDLSFAIVYISKFMTHPKVEHWTTAKKVLRYVKGIINFGILCGERNTLQLIGCII